VPTADGNDVVSAIGLVPVPERMLAPPPTCTFPAGHATLTCFGLPESIGLTAAMRVNPLTPGMPCGPGSPFGPFWSMSSAFSVLLHVWPAAESITLSFPSVLT